MSSASIAHRFDGYAAEHRTGGELSGWRFDADAISGGTERSYVGAALGALASVALHIGVAQVGQSNMEPILSRGAYNLQVLMVPRGEAQPGDPIQFGLAHVIIGLSRRDDTLSLNGLSRNQRATRIVTRRSVDGGPWVPIEVTDGSMRRLNSGIESAVGYGTDTLPEGGPYSDRARDRLLMAGYGLGELAGQVSNHWRQASWDVQLVLDGGVVEANVGA